MNGSREGAKARRKGKEKAKKMESFAQSLRQAQALSLPGGTQSSQRFSSLCELGELCAKPSFFFVFSSRLRAFA